MGTEIMPITRVKTLLEEVNIKKRFEEILGTKAPQFMASIVNVVSGSNSLQKCDPNSIMASAFIAASFDLPIDQNLGFAAIVPYKLKAQFQMMYKGFIQLAIRSGQYSGMNVAEVYEDELKSYNPITGAVKFGEEFPQDSQRNRGEEDKIVGFYAWFTLLNGFKQSVYLSKPGVEIHARTYSEAYKYDIRDKKKSSKWSTDFKAMGKKTLIKMLLSKWGILSIDMQRAITEDQKIFDGDKGVYADNPEFVDKRVADPFDKAEQAQVVDEQKQLGSPSNLTEQEKKEYGIEK